MHTYSDFWKKKGFLTTKGTPIAKVSIIAMFLEAIQLPSEVSIVHCQGHQSHKYPEALGNAKTYESVSKGLASSSNGSMEHILFLTPSNHPCYQPEEKD